MECNKLIIKTNKKYYLTHLKGLLPKSSPREAPVKNNDYGLSFAKKVKNVNLVMGQGADVKFGGHVDNINAEVLDSVENNDYGLSFAKKVGNMNLVMNEGADVQFNDVVDNINAKVIPSEWTASTPERVTKSTTTTTTATTTTTKEGTLTHCKIESLTFAVDISSSMRATMPIWKSIAQKLLQEMAIKEVNITRHALFTFEQQIHDKLIAGSFQDLITEVNKINHFPGEAEYIFAGLKHAMEKVKEKALVLVWTDSPLLLAFNDLSNAALKAEVLNLKKSTKSEIFFMVASQQIGTDLAPFRKWLDDVGTVVDLRNGQAVITRIIDIMKNSTICN